MSSESHAKWKIDTLLSPLEEAYEREGVKSAWPTEKEHVINAIDKISARLPPRYTPDSSTPVLGVGGSGIVLRLKDSLFPSVDNALKMPRPVPGKIELVSEMLGKEMLFLANLRHPGIVKILYYTTLTGIAGYGNLPFYLMETVDGAKSQKFVTNPATTEGQLYELIRQTAEIIDYLHTNPGAHFAHLDIKPDNIVTDQNGRAVMIDMGTCKLLKGDSHKTLIACTQS